MVVTSIFYIQSVTLEAAAWPEGGPVLVFCISSTHIVHTSWAITSNLTVLVGRMKMRDTRAEGEEERGGEGSGGGVVKEGRKRRGEEGGEEKEAFCPAPRSSLSCQP